jgi:predicted transcriptional regulator
LLLEKDGVHHCLGNVAYPILQLVEFEIKDENMTPITNVRVWWDASVSAYRLASPYNKDFVEGLKAAIPISDRSYDPDTKIWTFVERQLAPVQQFFKMMNVQATVITRQQTEQASQSTPQGPRKNIAIAEITLEFFRLAGPDAMLKAYRAAALTLHPDRGGSMDVMSSLNAAWDRIQKEVFKVG